MKRKQFLTNLVQIAGGVTIYGCKNDFLEFDSASNHPDDLAISKDDAQAWFEKEYIQKFNSNNGLSARKSNKIDKNKELTRKLNWQLSESNKSNFIWIPIQYNNSNETPAFIVWKEGEEYVQTLAKYLSYTVAEGFIVYRGKSGEINGHISQVAYDPVKHPPGKIIDPKIFTGAIISADWDDNIIKLFHFENGKLITSYDASATSNSRVANCTTYYTQYGVVTGHPCPDIPNCHEIYFTYYTTPHTICSNGSGSGSGGDGYPWYPGSGSGSDSGGGSSTPLPGSYVTELPYSVGQLSYDPAARSALNTRIIDATNAVGFAGTITDFSIAKAQTILKSLGIAYTESLVSNMLVLRNLSTGQLIKTIGSRVGVAGAISGGAVLISVFMEHGFNVSEYSTSDWINIAASTVGLVGAIAGSPWIVTAAAGTSIILAVYSYTHRNTPDNGSLRLSFA